MVETALTRVRLARRGHLGRIFLASDMASWRGLAMATDGDELKAMYIGYR
jgi:hypothetical protein